MANLPLQRIGGLITYVVTSSFINSEKQDKQDRKRQDKQDN